jgi:hypothetical protein
MPNRVGSIDAVPALYPSALLEPQPGGPVKSMIRIDGAEILPLGGISNKLSVFCNELGDYVFYQSDARGLQHERKSRRQSPDAKKLTELAKLNMLRSSLGLISRQEILVEEEARANREVDMALFKSILMQAKSTVESWGGSLYFVYFPQWERYASSKPLKVNRKQVLEIVTGLQIPLIDLHSTLRSHTDPLSLFPFRLFGHYNADGNRLVAEAVLKQLAR